VRLARGTHEKRPVELTLVALVDLLLLLVMYFILAGSFDRPRLIELARGGGGAGAGAPAAGGASAAPRPVLVRLRADGTADLNGEPLPAPELARRLAARPDVAVLLRSAPDAALGDLVALLDALTAAGVTAVSLLDADTPRP
jgi:biopolymer transport protein ExbD